MITLLFWLFAAHFLGDYVFQTDTIAREKNYQSETELQKVVPWFYWLTAHAYVHGVLVALATGSAYLGIGELIAHWLIDYGKCNNWYDLKWDQLFHILCKILWFSIIIAFAGVR